MFPAPLTQRFQTAAAGCAIAVGFALPISTAATNILLGLTLLFYLFTGQWQKKWQCLSNQPVAWLAVALCGLALAGCAWGLGNAAERQSYFGKYLTLLLIPLLLPFFDTARRRYQALAAFVAGMLLTLLLSIMHWLAWSAWLPPSWLGRIAQMQDPLSLSQNAVVFKLSITHGFFMALAAYLLLLAARQVQLARQRGVLLLLAVLAAANVLFMIAGRTGYVVLALLATYLLLGRGLVTARRLGGFVMLAVLLGTLVWQTSTTMQQRVLQARQEAQAWQPGQGSQTSIGLRLDYWGTALKIISEQPLTGVGTGGFAAAYKEKIAGTAIQPSTNPHNQYLLTTAQLGLPGLLLLLLLHAAIWRQTRQLPQLERDVLRGVLLAYLAGNMFNSFMFDFSERYLFVWLTAVLLAASPSRAAARNADADRSRWAR